MANVREPKNPLEKRDLLHAESPKLDRINAIAAKMLSDGRHAEAVDYVELTKDSTLVKQLADAAVGKGSTFLLQQAERIGGTEPSAEQWAQLIENAKRAERWLDAVRALTLSGDAEAAEALRLDKCPDYEPFKPLGK